MDTLAHELTTLVAQQLKVAPERLRPETNLIADLGADSLDLVEMVMAMEKQLGVSIADAEAETVKTFGDALTLLRAKRAS